MVIRLVTALGWMVIFGLTVVFICIMFDVLRNIWLNYGWSQPIASSIVAALIGIAAWWLFGGLVSLSAIGSRSEPPAPGEGPAVVNQTANASAGSTINQAGRDINQGVSEETLRKAMSEKLAANLDRIIAKYPGGYVILGIADGKVVHEGKTRTGTTIEADWDNVRIGFDETNDTLILCIPQLVVVVDGGNLVLRLFEGNVEVFRPVKENEPLRSCASPNVSYELLDKSRRILLIGIK
jgi:hypothetical protein